MAIASPLAPEAPPLSARRGLVLGLVLVAQFMVVIDSTIVTVALPSIQSDLGFGSQLSLQWVINAYVLLFGGVLLLGGRLSDLIGRQRLLIAGMLLFTGASLANGLAQNPGLLIGGRAVQGLGAALVSPAVLSIIVSTYTVTAERTRALGIFSAVTAGASAAGMIAGGVLTQALSWRWIFLVNVPIGVFAVAMALRFIPHARGQRRQLDVAGAATITASMTALTYAIVNAQDWGWSSARFLGLVAAAVALFVAFLGMELRSREPLVRLAIFGNRSLSVANIVMFLMVGGLFTTMFFPTLYMQQIFGYGPIKTGFAYLVWPVTMAVAAGIGERLNTRFDPRITLVSGLLLVSGGLFSFHSLPADGSYAVNLLPGLLLTAAGAGLAWATLFVFATSGVRIEEAGLASGLINTSQQIGSAIGLAALATVAAAHTADLLPHAATSVAQADVLGAGFARGFLIAGFLPLAGAAIAAIAMPKTRPATHDEAVLAEAEAAVAIGGE
jgi:EmrB/QacA subfamily drug resistance transporter